MISEFVRRTGAPQLFVTASLQATARDDLALLAQEADRTSTLPGHGLFGSNPPPTWDGALRLIAAALPAGRPAIVVLDEFPWFLARDAGLEGVLQVIWDRVFEEKQVLLILVGSDVAMMEALSTHGRPLFGRTQELTVHPFHPADTAAMLPHVTSAADVLDLQLVTGGFPRLVRDSGRFKSAMDYVTSQLTDENSSLCVNAARMLDAELPSGSNGGPVLRSVGSGERTFRNIAKQSGLADQSVQRSFATLLDKHLIARDLPASVPPSENPRYRIDDSYLRFWLALVAPGIAEIERGRSDLAQDRVNRSWLAWRGRAIEPLVRQALLRLAMTDDRLGAAGHVSGWWPRNNQPEIDLVGVDLWPNPSAVRFVGSIKWRDAAPFTVTDARALERDVTQIPGVDATTTRVAVARIKVEASDIVAFVADDIVAAWQH